MVGEKQITMKNGQKALSGTCPVCGTKMFKIGGGKTKVAIPKAKAGTKKPATKSSSKAKSKTKSKTKKK